MFLGPSKPWWAYLALRSNEALGALLTQGEGRAIFFDDPSRLPTSGEEIRECHFFYVLWDGIVDPPALRRAAAMTETSRGMVLLPVGHLLRIPSDAYRVEGLYAAGPLQFRVRGLRFDWHTRRVLLDSAVRRLLMPFKNMRYVGARAGLELLLGRPRLVFCGSYGIGPEFLRQLCERHEISLSHFEGFPFYEGPIGDMGDGYRGFLRRAGSLLAGLLGQGVIDTNFLASGLHVLGREYFVKRMHGTGLPVFVNGSAKGVNINVYTTPFYRQHVFPDFGSSVGTGNYPRLADLLYFRKRVVPVELVGDLEAAETAAASGELELYFERRWDVYEPQLRGALETASAREG